MRGKEKFLIDEKSTLNFCTRYSLSIMSICWYVDMARVRLMLYLSIHCPFTFTSHVNIVIVSLTAIQKSVFKRELILKSQID